MRSTLFYIPHSIGPWPVFGLGWALLALIVAWILVRWFAVKSGESFWAGIASWATTAALIVLVLPVLESKLTFANGDEAILGLPIRGYGLMMLLGVVSGTYWTYRRGINYGLTFDALLSLAFWGMGGGIIGARLFYVIQKWAEIPGQTLVEKLIESLKFTEGGLVVYGGMIGGLISTGLWCWLRQRSYLMLADIVTPPFLLGLALGRIGCLFNGCCYGAVCYQDLPAIEFPSGSPPYMDQLATGDLIGAKLQSTANKKALEVISIEKGGWADKHGLTTGDWVKIETEPNLDSPASAPKVAVTYAKAGRVLTLDAPQKSLPVHPSQIYASINAAILSCLLACLVLSFQMRGRVVGAGLMLYGFSRIIEEFIRVDEAGQFGTTFSIGQWVSFAGIIIGVLLLLSIHMRKQKSPAPFQQTLAKN